MTPQTKANNLLYPKKGIFIEIGEQNKFEWLCLAMLGYRRIFCLVKLGFLMGISRLA
jgi:hypothetical protein